MPLMVQSTYVSLFSIGTNGRNENCNKCEIKNKRKKDRTLGLDLSSYPPFKERKNRELINSSILVRD